VGVSAAGSAGNSSADNDFIRVIFLFMVDRCSKVASEKLVLRRPMMTHRYQEWSVPTFNCPTLFNKGHN
jgi:hypothetical protein